MTTYAPIYSNKQTMKYFSLKAIPVKGIDKPFYVLAEKGDFTSKQIDNSLLPDVLSLTTDTIIEKVNDDYKDEIAKRQEELNYLLWKRYDNPLENKDLIEELLQSKSLTDKGKRLVKQAANLPKDEKEETFAKATEDLILKAQNALSKTYHKARMAIENEVAKNRQRLIDELPERDIGEIAQAVKLYIGRFAYFRLVLLWDMVMTAVELEGAGESSFEGTIKAGRTRYSESISKSELWKGQSGYPLQGEPRGGIKPFMDFIKGRDATAYEELNDYAKRAIALALKPLTMTQKEVKELFVIANKEHEEGTSSDDEGHEKEVKSIKMYNTFIRKDPNDKITKMLFSMTDEEAEKGLLTIIEGKSTKKKLSKKYIENPKDIYTYVKTTWESGIDKYLDEKKFEPYEREVIKAAMSEHITHTNGDTSKPFDTTPEILYRAMAGDDGNQEKRKNPSPETIEKIKKAIYKGAHCWMVIDLSEACKEYGYNEGKPCKLEGYLLPCSFIDGAIVNGKATTIIHFSEISPLFRAAEIKNGQILTYKKKLLNIPTVSNTVDVISIKGYLLQRILEITQHYEDLNSSLLVSSILEANNLTDINRKAKSKLIKAIEEMLNYWLAEKVFAGYSLQDRNGVILRGKCYKKVDGGIKIVDLPQKKANLGIYKIEILRKRSQSKKS